MLKNVKQRHLSREKLISIARDLFGLSKCDADSYVIYVVNTEYRGGWARFTAKVQDGTL